MFPNKLQYNRLAFARLYDVELTPCVSIHAVNAVNAVIYYILICLIYAIRIFLNIN